MRATLSSFLLSSSLLAGAAHAETRQFVFTGTVSVGTSTVSLSDVGIDSPVSGTLSYDTALATAYDDPNPPHGVAGYSWSLMPGTFEATFSGHRYSASGFEITAINALPAFWAIDIVNAGHATLDGQDIGPGRTLQIFMMGQTKVPSESAFLLPDTYDLTDSDWAHSITIAPDGLQSETGDKIAFYFTSITAVPEPSTYAMLFVGLAGLSFVARRNRKKSAH